MYTALHMERTVGPGAVRFQKSAAASVCMLGRLAPPVCSTAPVKEHRGRVRLIKSELCLGWQGKKK